MKLFTIKQNDQLSDIELKNLMCLANVCVQHDGVIIKLHWDIIKHQREITGNFLCYDEDNLIGYLSFFLFEEDAVHISAMVHPEYRRQSIFLRLLQAACIEIINLGINKIKFSIPIENEMAKLCLSTLGGEFSYFEYKMARTSHLPEVLASNILTIRNACIDEVALIAEMDSICFNSDYAIILQRYQDTMRDANRQIWLAYLGDECIGKAHVCFEGNKAFIHDVAILPGYQKNGYGTFLLKYLINRLIQLHDCHQMHLEVDAKNDSALNMYKKCGFKITNTYEYWTLRVN